MPPSQDPMVARRRLRDALRRFREEAHMTQKDVAAEMDWSLSKLIRIEAGSVNISTNDLRVLLPHYGVTGERADELLALSREARQPAWWTPYRPFISAEYGAFLGYETSARLIRNHQPVVVPGLLQTSDYARVLMGSGPGAEERISLRLQRQEILEREDPPELHFILDQAAITRVVGGPSVMRHQLEHLRRMAEHPAVTLRIVPWEAGLYPRCGVAYVLVELEYDEPNVLYVERADGELIVAESMTGGFTDGPVQFLETFWEVELLAPVENTDRLLAEALDRLG
jgi:transcriptional regulator with XRE-family HTH domain